MTEQGAPDLGVNQWFDPSGQPLPGFDPLRGPEPFKLVFCFQHACPGCHRSGFPTLARIADALHGTGMLGMSVVQTVFEDFERNTLDAMLQDQRRYALPMPFGHDAGDGRSGSQLMWRFANGGTPWFILLDPDGTVVFEDFAIDPDRLADYVRHATQGRGEPSEPAPPSE